VAKRVIVLATIRVALIIVAVRSSPAVAQSTDSRKLPRFGVCQREGDKIAGVKPVRINKDIPLPKKIRDVRPRYPDAPEGALGRGMWMGEVLMDRNGKVSHVWPLREVQFTPPFPAVNEAIVDAIKQWEYEPVVVKSQAVPWCMTITVNIHWQ
jgi:protein TonB